MFKTKEIASCLVLALGLSVCSPAMAATTTTTVPNQFTMAQIQTLAVQNNRANDEMTLNLQLLEENRMTADNTKAELEDALYTTSSSAGYAGNAAAQMQSQINALRQKMATETDKGILASYQAQLMVLESQQEQLSSAAGSAGSGMAGIKANQQKVDTQLDTITSKQDDLKKSQADWESEVRLISGALVIKAVTLQNDIDLMEQSNALAAKMEKLEGLKTSLGLSIDLNVTGKALETTQGVSKLQQAQAGLKSYKRQINDLIGRPLDAQLNLVGIDLPKTVQPAPAYNEALVETLIKNNYTLKTMERDIIDYHKQGDALTENGVTNSSEYKILDRSIDLKKLDMEKQKNTIANDAKAQLDQINSTGRAYTEALQAYDKEAKNASFLKMRLDLGLIAPLEYQGAELALQQADTQRTKAGYSYYLAREEYNAMLQGIPLNNYKMIK